MATGSRINYPADLDKKETVEDSSICGTSPGKSVSALS